MNTPKATPFLMWYEDDPKRSIPERIADGIAAFTRNPQFGGAKPDRVLINPHDLTDLPDSIAGCRIEARAVVQRNCYWIGAEEETSRRAEHERAMVADLADVPPSAVSSRQ